MWMKIIRNRVKIEVEKYRSCPLHSCYERKFMQRNCKLYEVERIERTYCVVENAHLSPPPHNMGKNPRAVDEN